MAAAKLPALVVPSNLELFAEPPLDLSSDSIDEVPYHPNTVFRPDSGDLNYKVGGTADEFIDPSKTYMTFGTQVTRGDGSIIDLAENHHVIGVCNLFPHAIFGRIYVTVNGV